MPARVSRILRGDPAELLMRAVVMRGTGGTEVVAIEERPAPEAGGNRIRVRVHAAGLNRADIQQRLGR